MRKLILIASVCLLSFVTDSGPLTPKERKFAANYLQKTEKQLFDEVSGLSPEQLSFKPAQGKWSVEDCVKHIAITEKSLWAMADSIIGLPANPDMRKDIKVTDEEVIRMLNDRSQKRQAVESLQPQNSPYHSLAAALDSFRIGRQHIISFVNDTDADLRDHVAKLGPGPIDAYQVILLIAAHSHRHTKQIQEVKKDPSFPGNQRVN